MSAAAPPKGEGWILLSEDLSHTTHAIEVANLKFKGLLPQGCLVRHRELLIGSNTCFHVSVVWVPCVSLDELRSGFSPPPQPAWVPLLLQLHSRAQVVIAAASGQDLDPGPLTIAVDQLHVSVRGADALVRQLRLADQPESTEGEAPR